MSKKKNNKRIVKQEQPSIFAYGGVSSSLPTLSELNSNLVRGAMDAMNAGYQSASKTDWLSGLGEIMQGIGTNMTTSGLSKIKDAEGFTKFMQDNWNTINSGNRILSGILGSNSSMFALGGEVPFNNIEAEGGEVIETPTGLPQELFGPSHEQGGINMQVPSGTEIYSKRVKGEDGKTMAKRKKEREANLEKIQKKLDKDPTNKLLLESLNRVKQNNDLLDKKDLAQMEEFKNSIEESFNIGKEKFALGGTTNPINPLVMKYMYDNLQKQVRPSITNPILGDEYSTISPFSTRDEYPDTVNNTYSGANSYTPITLGNNIDENGFDTTDSKIYDNGKGIEEVIISKKKPNITEIYRPKLSLIEKPLSEMKIPTIPETNPAVYVDSDNKPKLNIDFETLKKSIPDYTFGDMLGIYANWKGNKDVMDNTREQWARTPREVNHFKDYGQRTLSKLNQEKDYLNAMRNEQLGDIELSRNASLSRNQNSARGINTIRALNLASDAQHDEAISNIYNQYMQENMRILDKEAETLRNIDEVTMRGDEQRADRELRNTDNMFSNLARNIADKYEGIEQIGKTLNNAKTRDVQYKMWEQLYRHLGIDPNTGEINYKNEKGSTYKDDTKRITKLPKEVLEDYVKKGIDPELAQAQQLFDKNENNVYVDKEGNLTTEGLKYLEDNSDLWNNYDFRGKPLTAQTYYDYLKAKNSGRYVDNLVERDTAYKDFIDKNTNLPFTSMRQYKRFLKDVEDGLVSGPAQEYYKIIGEIPGLTQKLESLGATKETQKSIQDNLRALVHYTLGKNLDFEKDPVNSAKALQKILKVKEDGKFGKNSLDALISFITGKPVQTKTASNVKRRVSTKGKTRVSVTRGTSSSYRGRIRKR